MEEKNSFGRIKEKSRELRREVKQRITGYIVAALGLVAGLAWNDAIRALIEYVFPMDQGSVWAIHLRGPGERDPHRGRISHRALGGAGRGQGRGLIVYAGFFV